MVAQYQLVNVRVKGQIDNQACDNTLWYYTSSPGGCLLKTFADCVHRIFDADILPNLHDVYKIYQVEAWALAGVRNVIGGTDASPELKSTRAMWGERYLNSTPIQGLRTGTFEPMPSFNAVSVEKVIGQTGLVNPTTGISPTGNNAILKGGGMRLAGLHEDVTATGEPNLMTPQFFSAISTAVKKLRFITVAATLPDSADTGKFLNMAVVSTTELGRSRQDRTASATDPRLWTPAWVAGTVSSMAASQYVSSQVSRKRTPRKFQ